MKLNEVLSKTIQFFKDKNFDTPRLEAELLISHALKMPRIQLYVKFDSPLTDTEVSLCRDYVRRRTAGEPVAYITEEKGFYGLVFKVKSGVLIPRPETEQIVDEVLAHYKKNPQAECRILDLGAGSGCIGLSLIKNIPNAQLIAVEKSAAAFTILEENTALLELNERAQLLNKAVEDLNWPELGPFNYIVSNPPYIDESDPLVEANVRKFEPNEALFASEKGFGLLKSWSKQAAPLLAPQGLMLFEMGHAQGPALKTYFSDLPRIQSVEILKDLSGLDRIIKARA